MPAPYSLDFRQKVIAALEAGHSKASISRLMGVGTTTLTEWHNRYRATGALAAKQGYQQGHSHKLPIGRPFAGLPSSMAIKHSGRWPSYGRTKLVRIPLGER